MFFKRYNDILIAVFALISLTLKFAHVTVRLLKWDKSVWALFHFFARWGKAKRLYPTSFYVVEVSL